MSEKIPTSIIRSTLDESHEQGYLQLPFDKDSFSQFIGGLLGKPQTINTPIRGNFEVNKESINQVYQLINQRIIQQNDANLVQFNVRVIYSDNSSVIFNSLLDFMTYNEVRPIVSDEVHLTFLYLITFRDKTIPEKQEINISIISSSSTSTASKRFNDYSFGEYIFDKMLDKSVKVRPGLIQYEIKHTARTWASDIDSLLTGFFKTIMNDEVRIAIFVSKHNRIIRLFLIMLLFLILGYNGSRVVQLRREEYITQTNKLFSSGRINTHSLNERLKHIALHLHDDEEEKSQDFATFIISGGLVFFLYIFTANVQPYGKSSFLLLTRESEKNRDKINKRYSSRLQVVVGIILFNIVLNLAASYIYEEIFTINYICLENCLITVFIRRRAIGS